MILGLRTADPPFYVGFNVGGTSDGPPQPRNV
jgi:hypothetical protein